MIYDRLTITHKTLCSNACRISSFTTSTGLDPSIITYFVDIKKKGLTRINFSNKYDKINPYIYFIIELASLILNENNIKYFKNEWDIDIIQYNLSGEIDVDSTLALHKEDDNGYNMVSVLFYFRLKKQRNPILL